MRRFPKCFPENFESEILPKEAQEKNIPVYRIIKHGKIDRDSFISTFEEMQRKMIPSSKKARKLSDPGLYSTSCNIAYNEAEYALKMFMRHNPKAFIAKGETEKTCGPCQLTSDRDKKQKNTHVDWWVYEEANPQIYFKKVEIDE